ncbi:cytochrome P450 [Curvularia clavata]|uniref:Cytochrome P450 n=1 Tax=Curvularia clavata TaxID=95742 RepID=A0A9Q8ZA46_CURCL|nr:cytochrome P450 [Curvularia clavata]
MYKLFRVGQGGGFMSIGKEMVNGGLVYYIPNIIIQVATIILTQQKGSEDQFILPPAADGIASAQALRITRSLWRSGQKQRYQIEDPTSLTVTGYKEGSLSDPKVPSVGFWSIPYFGSWIAGIKFMRNPVRLVQEGMGRAKNGLLLVATLSDEFVLVTTKEKVAEYMKAPDSVLNMQDGANDAQQIPFTMGYGVAYRTYHNVVVRKQITPNLSQFTADMVEEVSVSFQDLIGSPRDWKPIPLYQIIAMTVARVSNKIFVGGDFYRNAEYLQNATDYAQAVVLSAEVLRLFPHWAKRYLVKFLPVTKCMRKAMKFLGPMVQDRIDGKYPDGKKPEDLIQWLIDAAPPIEKTAYQLVERVMALNVASIHTTTMTFTAAIYSLAAEPAKYMDTLRAEVIQNLVDGRLTHETIQNLVYIDSFLRESARFNVAGLAALQRHARQSFTFSDGTIIPAGAKVAFEGFRFVQERDGKPALEKTVVTTGTDFHLFGHGRHPCPGRFFAVHEMKIMFAILVLHYDIELAPGTKPKETYIATMAIPDTGLNVLFRSRVKYFDLI